MKKTFKLILVFSVFFLIQACTRLQLAYNFAPRLIANSLDDNFDFSSGRYTEIKSKISADLKNNKSLIQKELLDNLDLIRNTSQNKEIKQADIEKIYNQIHATQTKLVYAFQTSFTEVLDKISKEELESYKSEITKKHKKFEDRLTSNEKFLELSVDKFKDNMNLIFDDVTDKQIELYKNFIIRNHDYFVLNLAHKRNFLNKFQDAINNKEQLRNLALQYFSADDALKSDEFIKAQNKFLSDMFQETVQLWKTLTPDQIKYFYRFLNQLENSIKTLN